MLGSDPVSIIVTRASTVIAGHLDTAYEEDNMTLPFEEPLKMYVRTTNDFMEKEIYIGEAYQNPYGYWARTDGGTFSCRSIEEAIRMVVDFMNLEARGLRRIDPPPAVVEADEISDEDLEAAGEVHDRLVKGA